MAVKAKQQKPWCRWFESSLRRFIKRGEIKLAKNFVPEITSELAEEIGWHIGDGSMNYYNHSGKLRGIYQLRGHITDDRQHYEQRIKPIFEKLYNIKINLREMPSTRVFGFQIWNDKIIEFKKKLGLPLGKKFDVSIPLIFLKNKEIKSSLIRGIFDTDGGLYLEKKNKKLYPRIEIRTISLKLANQLLKVLKNLGFRVTFHSEHMTKDTLNRKRAYVISVRGVEMLEKWMKIIKPANPKHVKKFILFNQSKAL